MKKKIIIIGGAGFIGTNAVFNFVKSKYDILVLDSLGYAGNLININLLIKSIYQSISISISLSSIYQYIY